MIKCVILDVDGVLTDGTKLYDKDHNVIGKRFCDRDFTAIKRFKEKFVRVILLTGDKWNVGMAEKRGIEIHVTRDKKLEFVKSLEYEPEEICYVGDDIFDIPVLEYVGHPYVVNDAAPELQVGFKRVVWNGGTGVASLLYRDIANMELI